MHLTKVTLKNFGPHKDFSCELGHGLIGVVGHNGSGKSTLINAIYACLTNDFSRFENRKSGVINDLAPDDAPCYVEVEGCQDKTKFVLRRNIRPSSSRLTLGAGITEEVYRKQGDIEQRLIKDLGLTRKIVDSYVFVPQWGMFDFLSQTPAKRAEVFSYLCKTEQATALHKACGNFLSSSLFSSAVVDNRAEILTQIEETKSSISELESDLASNMECVLSEEESKKIESKLRLFETFEEKKNQIHCLEAQIVESRNALERLKNRAVDLVADRKLHLPYVITEQSLAYSKNVVKCHEAWLTASSSIESLEERIAIIEADKPSYRAPSADKCPTCQQEISSKKSEDISKAMFAEELATWQSSIDSREETLKSLKASLPAETYAEGHYELALDRIKNHESSSSFVMQAEAEIKSLKSQGEAVKKRLRIDSKSRSELVDAIAEESLIDYTEEHAEGGKLRLKYSQDYKDKCTFIQGSINSCKSSLQNFESLLKSLDEKLQEEKQASDLSDVVKEVRELFAWSNLPRLVSLANLKIIVGEVNKALENFDSPFWVEADENLSFVVHLPGGVTQPAGSLSGGQKVVLAICFRSAVNKIFGNDIGMMFLDEPTAGLDSDNLNNFKVMLETMSKAIKDDFQLFVITHEELLSSSFTQTINVCSHE